MFQFFKNNFVKNSIYIYILLLSLLIPISSIINPQLLGEDEILTFIVNINILNYLYDLDLKNIFSCTRITCILIRYTLTLYTLYTSFMPLHCHSHATECTYAFWRSIMSSRHFLATFQSRLRQDQADS